MQVDASPMCWQAADQTQPLCLVSISHVRETQRAKYKLTIPSTIFSRFRSEISSSALEMASDIHKTAVQQYRDRQTRFGAVDIEGHEMLEVGSTNSMHSSTADCDYLDFDRGPREDAAGAT